MIEVIYKEDMQEEQEAVVLPKNVRQVGEVQRDRKIYIEDYVITYMKQQITENKNLGCILVLMGSKKYTADTLYMFVNGAFAVNYQSVGADYGFGDAIWEEIYETIKKYFISSEIVGWLIYDDELSEDKLIKGQRKNFPGEDLLLLKQESYEDESVYYLYREGSLQRLQGFFVYYEKNQAMQEFMVEHMGRDSEEQEEKIRQREVPIARYRSRLKERERVQKRNSGTGILFAVSSVLVLLVLLVGISMINNYDKILDIRDSMEEMTQASVETVEQVDEVVLEEEEEEELSEIMPENIPEEEIQPEETPHQEEPVKEIVEETVAEVTPNYYTVQVGDTLIGISKTVYGNPQMVKTLCEVNGIADGDKIQAGQKILLP